MIRNLVDLYEKHEHKYLTDVSQYVNVTYNGQTRQFEINYDSEGNITQIISLFDNLAHMENGKVVYDKDISIIEEAFNEVNKDITSLLYETGVNESFNYIIIYKEDEFDDLGDFYTNEEEVELEYTIDSIEFSYIKR